MFPLIPCFLFSCINVSALLTLDGIFMWSVGLGIGRPSKQHHVVDFVLSPFTAEEKAALHAHVWPQTNAILHDFLQPPAAVNVGPRKKIVSKQVEFNPG